eukprot:CAMPEP_0178393656 /NCGR_PEP_ID=MMETSP0689_2-20121128/12299_1 /TAXON_ID=160604 /ORGANISM="Amphidinium massartii, Strain CS-259" /LENGTH=966 /DNA_ID=CAMNT_0020014253 /DNA_START=68 /DNA_END=2965 /DNA_ORIENTATION=-
MARVVPLELSKVTPLEAALQKEEDDVAMPIRIQPSPSASRNMRAQPSTSQTVADAIAHSRGLLMMEPTRSTASRVSLRRGVSGRPSVESNGTSLAPGTGSRGIVQRLAVRKRVRSLLTSSGWYDSSTAASVRKCLQGKLFSSILMIALMVALFLSDIFVLAQVPDNVAQDVILTFVFVLFLCEFLGLSLTDASYIFGFFFWMDLLGTCSMLFDVSYALGPDATEPEKISDSNGGANNIIFLRAARVSKLAARAGRLSRLVKLLRYMPFMFDSNSNQARMARVISNQLTNVLSTRVAFLNICIVVVETVLGLFTFPTSDGSITAWTQMLDEDCKAYRMASSTTSGASEVLSDELRRFADFYNSKWYGPFSACCGELHGYSWSSCSHELPLDFPMLTDHDKPRRRSLIREVSGDIFTVSFDLSTPKQYEALMSIFLIIFIMLVMCIFGLVMSSNISVLALQPLERMLDVVRAHCAKIFKYTNDLEIIEGKGEQEDYDDTEQTSEFLLLEKVVMKLTAIADITTNKPDADAEMDENQMMVLNWMQGSQALPQGGLRKENSCLTNLSNMVVRPSSVLVSQKAMGQVPSHGTGGSSTDATFPTSMLEATLEGDEGKYGGLPHLALPADYVEALDTPFFNALEVSKDVKTLAVTWMMFQGEGCRTWVGILIPPTAFSKFVLSIEAGYLPNPFHNFSHAVDVMYTVSRFMRLVGSPYFFSEVTHFWLLLASMAHDIGHTAVNNQYLIETSHEYALKYNDRSPLENMHCAKLFQVLKNADTDILSSVERDVYKEIRKGIINAILHTDVVKHNDMVKELLILYELHSELFDANDTSDEVVVEVLTQHTALMCNMLLHGADVGNPMKPWDLCQQYAYLCLDEFFNQGDMEKAAGIPVQMLNDRDKVSRPQSQVGFVEFVIAPLVEVMVNVFPTLDHLADHLGSNIQSWVQVWQEEANPTAEALTKLQARAQKVANK